MRRTVMELLDGGLERALLFVELGSLFFRLLKQRSVLFFPLLNLLLPRLHLAYQRSDSFLQLIDCVFVVVLIRC